MELISRKGAYPTTYSISNAERSLIGCDIEGILTSLGYFLRVGYDEASRVELQLLLWLV